jgi:lysophospholipase L1-like esterase
MNSSPPQIPVLPAPLVPGLPNFAKRLASKKAVKIVALGSSTMEGEGGIVAFPYRLETALRQEYQNRHSGERRMIDVINRGIGGEEAPKEFLRMGRDVIAENPHLVIWQIGTNSVWQSAKDNPPSRQKTIAGLRRGVKKLRDAGKIDVILMDPQYVPALLTPATRQATEAMVVAIAQIARDMNVNLFRRFELMKAWHELEQASFDTMVDPTDPARLHDSDWATQKLAWALGNAILDKA